MSFLTLLFGRPLASGEDEGEKIGPGRGIGIFGLDALGSSAYGPEAALTILIPAGMAGLGYITPITLLIIVLIGIVYFSYRQTIKEYPKGGGTYTVASENLGTTAGLLAGTALMIDYTLVVAVGISAGVGALISVFPQLHPYILPICLIILVFITIINLRGVNDTGGVFVLPGYLFVACLSIVLLIGLWKSLISGGHPTPVVEPIRHTQVQEAITLWILIKTFASGCTALTGIEAVSNGVTVFKEPNTKNARLTLTLIIGVLIFMLISIAHLCNAYGITATKPGSQEYKSVLYLLINAVVGPNWFGYLTLTSVLLILIFQANTAFTGFPRLCSVIAHQGYLPQGFANRGRRLVYSSGIYVLFFLSAMLLIVFNGVTDKLIPLFAVGAFLAFTFSQAGMVMHWRRKKGAHAKRSMIINGIGTVSTGITVIVVIVGKFMDGAWFVLLLIPAIYISMKRVHHHYHSVEKQLTCTKPLTPIFSDPPIVVLPAEDWNNNTFKSLQSALSISGEIIIVHIKSSEQESNLQSQWNKFIETPLRQKNLPVPRLEILHSPYRLILTPIVNFILDLEKRNPNRQIAVVIPNLIESRWYQRFLHNQRAILLAGMLMYRGTKRIIIINVPWYLRQED